MNNVSSLNDQQIKTLIQQLQTETERYQQEKLAKKISCMKNEWTAELVADLFYSGDGYIRNTAIEILIALEKNALKILKEKSSDKDRNIRKFALDSLKYINGEQSCEIALTLLDDEDENVVEAALQVISHQKYIAAKDKLLSILRNTNSVWIINTLLQTFASLELKQLSKIIEEKIISLNATDIEKNILINTYIRVLGSIGSYSDINVIISKYSKDFMINDSNLIFVLSNLVIKEDIAMISEETINEIGIIFKKHWDFRNSDYILHDIAAFVKLQLNFFLADIEEIFNLYKDEEFFVENLYELIQKLQYISDDFLYKTLQSKEPELVVLGLKLIYENKISINSRIVENLSYSTDKEISEWAICIITNIKEYNNPSLIRTTKDCSDKIGEDLIKNISINEHQTIEKIIVKLEHQSTKVRRIAAEKLVLCGNKINIKLLEKIVKRNVGEQSIEALEVLFKIDENMAWSHITDQIDSMSENVRAGLINIVTDSQDDAFYSFMTTMINDPSQIVRRKVIKTLNKRINDRSLSLLIELYEAENDLINIMSIVSNLHRFNSKKIINIINDAACSIEPIIRLSAIKSLTFLDNSITEDILKILLYDQVDDVREAAKEALRKKEVTK